MEDIGFTWDVYTESWNKQYNQLREFHAEHGHARVPISQKPLYQWVHRQRQILRSKINNGKMFSNDDVKKISALNEMEFDWDTLDGDYSGEKERFKKLKRITFEADVPHEKWMSHFQRLVAFKENRGHCTVPSTDPEYQDLSNWVRHQRYLFKRNKLPEDRVVALEGIDFAWTGEDARWDRMYAKLVRFHAEYGHTHVPNTGDKRELQRWINQQRKALQNLSSGYEKNSREADKRLLALEKIPFE